MMLVPLTDADRPLILSHYLRLSPEDRYLRFFSALGDYQITRFVENLLDLNEGVAFGIMEDGALVGVGCVSKSMVRDDRIEAEAGFSVDSNFRSRGFASMLMSAMIGYCKGAGVDTLVMCCLRQNRKMQAIAKNFGLHIVIDDDEVYADLNLTGAANGRTF